MNGTSLRSRSSIIILTLVTAFALAASSCGDDDGGSAGRGGEERVRLAFFMAAAANSYAQAQLQGVEAIAEEMNASVETFDGKFESQTQFSQIQDAIASGQYDGFIISPNDGNALVPVVEEAIAAEIQVGCILAPCGPSFDTLDPQIDGQVVYAGIPFKQNGADIGELVVQACENKDPCEVAMIPGLPDLPLEVARLEGFDSVVGEHDSIEVRLTSAGEYLAETALPIAQDVLQANRGIDVIVSTGDQMIVGAEQAINDAGLAGKIALIGNGGNQLAIDAIKDGRWFGTAAGYPRSEGEVAAEYVIRAVRGEDVEPVGFGSSDLGDVGPLITKENVEEFEPQFKD